MVALEIGGHPQLLIRAVCRGLSAKLRIIVAVRMAFAFCSLWSSPASAILGQSQSDLAKLHDRLLLQIEEEPAVLIKMLPMLVAKPQHHWKDSRVDFEVEVMRLLTTVFPGKDKLIKCSECNSNRLHLHKDNRIYVNNGPLNTSEYHKIKQVPQYRDARSVVMVRETPAGISMRIVSIEDGAILFFYLADSSRNLEDARPWMNFSREYDRRQREESLSFVRINLGGLYSDPLFQVDFQEQWGCYNQHISGLTLSLVGPVAGIGVSYRYMFPGYPRADLGGTLIFPLQNIVLPNQDASETINSQVYQVMASHVVGNNFGFFISASAGGETNFSFGISMYNPMFMPFLL